MIYLCRRTPIIAISFFPVEASTHTLQVPSAAKVNVVGNHLVLKSHRQTLLQTVLKVLMRFSLLKNLYSKLPLILPGSDAKSISHKKPRTEIGFIDCADLFHLIPLGFRMFDFFTHCDFIKVSQSLHCHWTVPPCPFAPLL